MLIGKAVGTQIRVAFSVLSIGKALGSQIDRSARLLFSDYLALVKSWCFYSRSLCSWFSEGYCQVKVISWLLHLGFCYSWI